jgi:hypothetical protein
MTNHEFPTDVNARGSDEGIRGICQPPCRSAEVWKPVAVLLWGDLLGADYQSYRSFFCQRRSHARRRSGGLRLDFLYNLDLEVAHLLKLLGLFSRRFSGFSSKGDAAAASRA